MFRNAIIFICVLATIILNIWCLYLFLLDENTSLVDYKYYHTKESDIYPSVSLCLNRPFIDPASNIPVSKMNATTFKDFVFGRKFQNRMESISYDNVTIDPKSYLLNISMVSSKGTYAYPVDLTNRDSWKPSFYISKRSLEVKCITFDIPFLQDELVEIFEVEFNHALVTSYTFSISLSYPNQSLISSITPFNDATYSVFSAVYQISISMIDVLTRRNTRNDHCINDWKNHDTLYQEQLVKIVGCSPIYWVTSLQFPICNEKEQYVQLEKLINKKTSNADNSDGFKLPCRQIMKAFYDATLDSSAGNFKIAVQFNEPKYRETKHVEAFDFQSLIGNGGGYLGMILGVALFHLPDFFRTVFQLGKKMIRIRVDGVNHLSHHIKLRKILMTFSINVFYGLCIFSTFGMTAWYTHLYLADEDTSLVDFVPFNEEKSSIYPSISLCFESPFSSAKFSNTNIPINETSYKSVLRGEIWDEAMLDINYDEMTLDINDHLFEIRMQSTDFREYIYSHDGKSRKEWKPTYSTSRRSSEEKCISFNIPFVQKVQIRKFEIVLNTTIFDFKELSNNSK